MYSEQDKVKTWLTNESLTYLNHHDLNTGWTGLFIPKSKDQFKGLYIRVDDAKKPYTKQDKDFFQSQYDKEFLVVTTNGSDMAIKYLKMFYGVK